MVLPSFWWRPSVLGVSWLVAAHSILCFHLHMVVFTGPSLCAYLSKFPPSQGHQSHWSRAHPNNLMISWLDRQRPYFQIRPHSRVLWVRTSTQLHVEDKSQSITPTFLTMGICRASGVFTITECEFKNTKVTAMVDKNRLVMNTLYSTATQSAETSAFLQFKY